MNRLRVAVVGAGAIAQRNAAEAAASGVCTIAGVVDLNVKVARDMAKRLESRVFESYEQALDSKDVDAVLISTPHHTHRPMVVKAAEARKHVLVEKPMANTVADAEAMIVACRRAGVALTVNYSFRYLPRIQKARELVQAGAVGEVAGISIIAHQFQDAGYWMGGRSNSPDDWRSSKAKCGGGHLIMVTTHAIDYMGFITGLRANRVYSEYANAASPGDIEDIYSVSSRWGEKAVGSVVGSSMMRGLEISEQRVWGTKGTLVMSGDTLSMYSARDVDGKRPGQVHQFKKFPTVGWTAEWVKHFVDAVREGREPDVSGRDGWENIAFIEGAYRSMEEGRPVTIPAYSEENML